MKLESPAILDVDPTEIVAAVEVVNLKLYITPFCLSCTFLAILN